MYQDRGMLKWQGFFLSEHTEQIARDKYEAKKVEKPILDACQIEENEQKILYAMEFCYYLKFTLWRNGFIEDIKVRVIQLDDINKIVKSAEEDGNPHFIPFDSIISVEVLEQKII